MPLKNMIYLRNWDKPNVKIWRLKSIIIPNKATCQNWCSCWDLSRDSRAKIYLKMEKMWALVLDLAYRCNILVLTNRQTNTGLYNIDASWIIILKTGSDKIFYWLCRVPFLLGFYVKKQERLCSELLLEDKIKNLLVFLQW